MQWWNLTKNLHAVASIKELFVRRKLFTGSKEIKTCETEKVANAYLIFKVNAIKFVITFVGT